MNRLSDYFKSLSMLSVATLLVGISQPGKSVSLDLASTQDSAPQASVKIPMRAPETKSKIVGYPGFSIDPAVIDAINKVFKAKDIPKIMNAPAQTTNATAACTDCNTA